MLASVGKIRPLFIDSLSRIGALTRTQQQSDPTSTTSHTWRTAFWIVALPWQALGLIDRDQRLIALGEWVLSRARGTETSIESHGHG
jgi:predicted NAD/FAD-dependent oxidoreductase